MPSSATLIVVGQRAEHRVVLQEVGHRVERAEVVDGDEVDVGAALLGGPEEVAADAAEAVDADADGHVGDAPFSAEARRPTRAGLRRHSESLPARRAVSRVDVAVGDVRAATPRPRRRRGDLLGDGHRAVAAAGAAEGDRQVALALGLRRPAAAGRAGRRGGRGTADVAGWLEHVVAHRPGRGRSAGAAPRPSAGSAGSGSRARCRRRAAGRACSRRTPRRSACRAEPSSSNDADEPVLELVDVEVGGVDDEVGRVALDRLEQRPLELDRLDQPVGLAGQRVLAAGARRSAGRARSSRRRGTARVTRWPAAAQRGDAVGSTSAWLRPATRASRSMPLPGRRRQLDDLRDQRRSAGCRRRTSRGPRARRRPPSARRRRAR